MQTTHSLGDGIEKAMADAEKRITRLLDKLHHSARGSAAFEGAERDVTRVLGWFEAKAHELEGELKKLAKGGGEPAGGATPPKEHRETAGTPESEEVPEPTPDPRQDLATSGG